MRARNSGPIAAFAMLLGVLALPAAGHAAFLIESLSGDITANELNAFVDTIQTIQPATNNFVRIYDNDVLKYTGADHGDATHYFKNGVYSNSSPSSRMDSRWRNLRRWTR